jgi:hypothetical protein
MSTETKTDELELAILNAFKRLPGMQKAGDEQDSLREELSRAIGEISVAVDLIREIRE